MVYRIISDDHGNQRRISDSPDRTNIVMFNNKKLINAKPPNNEESNNISSIGNTEINSNIENTIEDEKGKQDKHICTKGIGSCRTNDDGSMWLYVGTYKGRINFCPYCGIKAREQIVLR